MRRFKFRLFL